VPDYTKALNKNALKGKRIGVPRIVFLNDSITGNDPFINIAFEKALDVIKGLGATVVDPANLLRLRIDILNNEHLVGRRFQGVRIDNLQNRPHTMFVFQRSTSAEGRLAGSTTVAPRPLITSRAFSKAMLINGSFPVMLSFKNTIRGTPILLPLSAFLFRALV